MLWTQLTVYLMQGPILCHEGLMWIIVQIVFPPTYFIKQNYNCIIETQYIYSRLSDYGPQFKCCAKIGHVRACRSLQGLTAVLASVRTDIFLWPIYRYIDTYVERYYVYRVPYINMTYLLNCAFTTLFQPASQLTHSHVAICQGNI